MIHFLQLLRPLNPPPPRLLFGGLQEVPVVNVQFEGNEAASCVLEQLNFLLQEELRFKSNPSNLMVT